MPIKRIKDRTDLVTTFKLASSRKPHYVRVYVWANHAAMLKNANEDDDRTIACHCCNSWWEDPETGEYGSPPLLGELHFVSHEWSSQIVAHELQHAIIHRMRVLLPTAHDVIEQNPMDAEEEICYEFGIWFDILHSRLFELDHPENVIERAP